MGIFLLVVGLVWAIVGFGNIILGMSRGISENMALFSIIFNFAIFILPGLVVAGIGTLIRKKRGNK
jgi:hypothetical protein